METNKIHEMYHSFFGLTKTEEKAIDTILNSFDIDPHILAISLKKKTRNGEIRDFYSHIVIEIYKTAIARELSVNVGFTAPSNHNDFYRIVNSNLEIIKPVKEGIWSLSHPNTFTWRIVNNLEELKEALNNLVKF